jgi:hypothetical protein
VVIIYLYCFLYSSGVLPVISRKRNAKSLGLSNPHLCPISSTESEENPDGRWRKFSVDEILKRFKHFNNDLFSDSIKIELVSGDIRIGIE